MHLNLADKAMAVDMTHFDKLYSSNQTSENMFAIKSLRASTLSPLACGALSVPKKNLGLPLVAAASTACLCSSRLRMGKQNECGRRPPCN